MVLRKSQLVVLIRISDHLRRRGISEAGEVAVRHALRQPFLSRNITAGAAGRAGRVKRELGGKPANLGGI